MTSILKIEKAQFAVVEPIWREHLWANRASQIEATSAIDLDLSINMDLMNTLPSFWVAKSPSGQIVGVVSGHHMNRDYYRSRGLWVAPEWRAQGIGRTQMQEVFKQARAEGAKYVWTMPRLTAWSFYEKIGFVSQGITDRFELGPHQVAVYSL